VHVIRLTNQGVGDFPRAVIGVLALLVTSGALRSSVPRLDHGVPLNAPLCGDGGNAQTRLERLQDSFGLHSTF
jgi:hypothetical protein